MSYGKIRANFIEHNSAGSVDMQYVVPGVPKFFAGANQSGSTIHNVTTNSIGSESINHSSFTDQGSGYGQHNVTNNFNANDWNFYAASTHSNNTRTLHDNNSSTSIVYYEQHDADTSSLQDNMGFVMVIGVLA